MPRQEPWRTEGKFYGNGTCTFTFGLERLREKARLKGYEGKIPSGLKPNP